MSGCLSGDCSCHLVHPEDEAPRDRDEFPSGNYNYATMALPPPPNPPHHVNIVPKDSVSQRMGLDVVTWYHSHNAFTFVMMDGKSRTFPDAHIWYVEQEF